MSDGGTGNGTEVGHTLLQLIGRQDTDSYCNYRHATRAFYETYLSKKTSLRSGSHEKVTSNCVSLRLKQGLDSHAVFIPILMEWCFKIELYFEFRYKKDIKLI